MNIQIFVFCTAFLHHVTTSCCDHSELKKDNNETTPIYLNILSFGTEIIGDLDKEFPRGSQDDIDGIAVNLTELKYLARKEQFSERDNPIEPHPEDFDDSKEINSTAMDNSIPDEDEDFDFVDDIQKYVTKAGKLKLKLLGHRIYEHLNSTLNLTRVLYKSDKMYVTELEKYFNFISRKKVVNDIDREFIMLDIIVSSNHIFSKASKYMYNYMFSRSHSNNITRMFVKMMVRIIEKAVSDEENDGLKYICKYKYVCRHVPGYSDHVVGLLKRMLILPDDKFMITVQMLLQIVGRHEKLLKTFMDDDVATIISTEFKSLANSLPEVSEFISIVISVIKYRFKMYHSVNIEISNSTKAVRILIDLIDKTFEIMGDKYLNTEFNIVKKGMNDWVTKKRAGTFELWVDFCNEAVRVFKHYWNRETREEVKVLIEIIMKGTSKNNLVSDYLMTEGADFVQGRAVIYADDDNIM